MNITDNKNIIITGANRGIGFACLVHFLHESEKNIIYAVVRNGEKFDNIVSDNLYEYRDRIVTITADFSDEQSVKAAAKKILNTKNQIDILINNVGVSYKNSTFNMTSFEQIYSSFNINFFSPLLLTQYISKSMIRKKSGVIIFVTSIAAFDGGNNLEYVSSKAAIVGAIRRLALEYGVYNIRVNGVAPGFTDTDMGNSQPDELFNIAMNNNIIKRMARPDEIAKTIGFLASDDASYITGQIMKVSGNI